MAEGQQQSGRNNQADMRTKRRPVTSLKAHSQHWEVLVSFTLEKRQQAIKVLRGSLRELNDRLETRRCEK